MTVAFFVAGIIAAVSLLSLSVLGAALPKFQFWPPPEKGSWQDRLFLVLFRVMFVSWVLVCVLDFRGLGEVSIWLSVVGWLLLAVGFGMAFRITAQLGWRDAYGEANTLNTQGWFALSRNPIYVFSVFGMIGAALAVNSFYVNWILGAWALLYLLAPFVEEPWLERKYGEQYREYVAKVPRFVGPVRPDA